MAPRLHTLTEKQTTVARLAAQGYRDAQIGEILHLTRKGASNLVMGAIASLKFTGAERNVRVLLARWIWENDKEFDRG